MFILFIDTSNYYLIINLIKNNKILYYFKIKFFNNCSEILLCKIKILLKKNNIFLKDIKKIIFVNGPGSYTSLRVGIVAIKVISYFLKIKVYIVSSLAALSANFININKLIVPIINARRGYIYSGIYFFKNGEVKCKMKDCYILLKNLLKKLKSLKKDFFFVGIDIYNNKEIKNYLYKFNFLKINKNNNLNFTNGLNIIKRIKFLKIVNNIYKFVPNYLKLSEAEENLL